MTIPEVLNLECNLTIAHRIRCACSDYFRLRRDVLLPEVQAEADRRGVDSVDPLATYARGVHARHLSGRSLAA